MRSWLCSTSIRARINTTICANGSGDLQPPKVDAASGLDNLYHRLVQPGAPTLRAFARLGEFFCGKDEAALTAFRRRDLEPIGRLLERLAEMLNIIKHLLEWHIVQARDLGKPQRIVE
jgi:hypothetical protein